jgi:hypothetical protein
VGAKTQHQSAKCQEGNNAHTQPTDQVNQPNHCMGVRLTLKHKQVYSSAELLDAKHIREHSRSAGAANGVAQTDLAHRRAVEHACLRT